MNGLLFQYTVLHDVALPEAGYSPATKLVMAGRCNNIYRSMFYVAVWGFLGSVG